MRKLLTDNESVIRGITTAQPRNKPPKSDKKYYGAKSGTLLDTQKVYEGRLRELANIEKLEVAEPIQLQEARDQNLEIVYGKWLDDAERGTSEDHGCGQEQIGCDTSKHVRTRGRDAGHTTNQSVQNHCESSCDENKCEGPARLFDWQTTTSEWRSSMRREVGES